MFRSDLDNLGSLGVPAAVRRPAGRPGRGPGAGVAGNMGGAGSVHDTRNVGAWGGVPGRGGG